MADSSRIMTRGMKRKLEKGKEGDTQQNPQEKPKSKKFKPAPMKEAPPPQNTASSSSAGTFVAPSF